MFDAQRRDGTGTHFIFIAFSKWPDTDSIMVSFQKSYRKARFSEAASYSETAPYTETLPLEVTAE